MFVCQSCCSLMTLSYLYPFNFRRLRCVREGPCDQQFRWTIPPSANILHLPFLHSSRTFYRRCMQPCDLTLISKTKKQFRWYCRLLHRLSATYQFLCLSYESLPGKSDLTTSSQWLLKWSETIINHRQWKFIVAHVWYLVYCHYNYFRGVK